MKTDTADHQNTRFELSERRAADAADPFAVDLFAAHARGTQAVKPLEPFTPENLAAESESTVAPPAPPVAWHARLPRASAERARLSRTLATLPMSLAAGIVRAIESTLARLTKASAEGVRIEFIGTREADLVSAATRSGEPEDLMTAEFSIDPADASVYIEMRGELARKLVGRVLGGAEDHPARRPLSVIETAAFEFVCMSVAHETNRSIGSALWHLKSISDAPFSRSIGRTKADDAVRLRGYVFAVRVRIDAARAGEAATDGLVRCYLPAATLEQVAVDRAKLFPKLAANIRLERLKRVAQRVRASVRIGETRLTNSDLAALETGDVIVVERPAVSRFGAASGVRLDGDLRVRLGDGGAVVLAGNVMIPGSAQGRTDKGDALMLRFERIETNADAGRAEERVLMAQMTDETTEAQSETGALENLVLTLRVELGARRFTLDELAALRANQIIDLGCRATDQVDLTTENGVIARGELIDIEGRLGVRVTRVLV